MSSDYISSRNVDLSIVSRDYCTLAVRLGLGSVLGYMIAGIIIGPALGLVGSETNTIQHFAEFGIVMMLFLVGLEMKPRNLWESKS